MDRCDAFWRWLACAALMLAGCQETSDAPADPAPVANSENAEATSPSTGASAGTSSAAQNGVAEMLRVAEVHLLGNRILDAIVFLDDAVVAYPEDAGLALTLGKALRLESQDQDVPESLTWFEKAASLGSPVAAVWQARVLIDQDQFAKAQPLLEQFLQAHEQGNFPIIADALYLQASAMLHNKELETAQQQLDKAQQRANDYLNSPNPQKHPLDVRRLGGLLHDCAVLNVDLLLAQGNSMQARDEALALVERLPETEEPRQLYAKALESCGSTELAAEQRRAAQLLEEIETQTPVLRIPIEEVESKIQELATIEPVSPRLPIRTIRLYLDRQKFLEAMIKCREFRETNPTNTRLIGESWFLEGQCLLRAEQYIEALDCFAEAAEAMPGFRPEYERLRQQTEARMWEKQQDEP